MSIKYDTIGIDYNQTRKADPYLTERHLHHLNPTTSGLYLEIGCGTGNYTDALQQKEYSFIGIDPSNEMLDKAKQQNTQIDWHLGQAEATGLKSESINGIVAHLTIHHWTDLEKAFAELDRVLVPNGKIVIFTATPEQMKGYWLEHYFPKMIKDSIDVMPSYERIETAMTPSNFSIVQTEKYFVKPDLKDQFLYCGKFDPNFYFNEQIRRGISSFSAISNAEEVKAGLDLMKRDMVSDKIKEVMKSYENDLGDYLYIVAQKKS